ncbi:hypothetical protein AVEN_71970-1, partial [Araneus ventricosus]
VQSGFEATRGLFWTDLALSETGQRIQTSAPQHQLEKFWPPFDMHQAYKHGAFKVESGFEPGTFDRKAETSALGHRCFFAFSYTKVL